MDLNALSADWNVNKDKICSGNDILKCSDSIEINDGI